VKAQAPMNFRFEFTVEGTPSGEYICDPCGKLSRKDYGQVKKVFSALGGCWDTRRKHHFFSYDPTEKIREFFSTGKLPEWNPHSWFPTPPDYANLLAELLRLRVGFQPKILEPSAGDGRIKQLRDRVASSRSGYWEELLKAKFGTTKISTCLVEYSPEKMTDDECRHFIQLAINNDPIAARFFSFKKTHGATHEQTRAALDTAIRRHIIDDGGCVRWLPEDRDWAVSQWGTDS